MPRTPRTAAKSRLNLELTEDVRGRLESLRERTDADSLTEVIRRALAVYDFLWTQREAGGELVVRREGEGDRELVLL